jgi:hypothetical protein
MSGSWITAFHTPITPALRSVQNTWKKETEEKQQQRYLFKQAGFVWCGAL